MLKIFSEWFGLKPKLDEKENTPFFKERDIWWTHIGVNVGHEQDGKGNDAIRPVLVLAKFNQHLFLDVPQTTQEKRGRYYFTYTHKTEVRTLLLSQVRVFSTKRLKKKNARLSNDLFKEVTKSLQDLLFLDKLKVKPPAERGSEPEGHL